MTLRHMFWDTSALVPLLLPEAASSKACEVWAQCDQIWAWNWALVEVDAALLRRQADEAAWSTWREMEFRLTWLRLDADDMAILRSMNRGLGLRAADAGHVFAFERLSAQMPEIEMVTFDSEMAEAVRRLRLHLHAACA